MSLLHIPVRIIAADPVEAQAFADVLTQGEAGVLALAGADEAPLAVLVCPTGDVGLAGAFPRVVLGVDLPLPARMAQVLEALEAVASAASGFDRVRSFGAWQLDPGRLSLRGPGDAAFTLTDTEARLLACLFDAAGMEVTREALLQRVWGYRPGLDTHTLETHIYRLRRKVEPDPAVPGRIVTTASGYRFVA